MKLDLGALAKGYIADLLIAYLKEVHVTSALINLGGNIVTLKFLRIKQKMANWYSQSARIQRNNQLTCRSG